MRSTRATAAIARLNARSEGHRYQMVVTGAGLFMLQDQIEGRIQELSAALSLDDFVKLVDSLGPQKVRRVTKNDAAFAKQLIRKTGDSE
jgi:hypothetical protein